MITLPNGKSIDRDMLETAMEDSDLANMHFLKIEKGQTHGYCDDDWRIDQTT